MPPGHTLLAFRYLMMHGQVFEKPFEVDRKVGELLDAMESTLSRIYCIDFCVEVNVAQNRRNAKRILGQVNECLNFLNTYTRLPYCTSFQE